VLWGEGLGIRTTARITGVNHETVGKLALQVGRGCAELHDRMMVGLRVNRIECDELWSFVQRKRRWQEKPGADAPVTGDQYTYIALGASSRAIIAYQTGKRTTETTDNFIQDLRQRVIGSPEITTDGYHPYRNAIRGAFGNRVARCLAVDRPSLVRSVTLLAAGGLIGPATPLGTSFRNTTEVKMNGSDCVTVLGARWLSPASDPKILAQVECWPAVHLAHLATSRGMALEDWWGAGTAPLLVIQGLDDEAAPPGNGHALREQFGERVRVIDLPRAGHFLVLEQPEAVTRAIAEFVGAGAAPR